MIDRANQEDHFVIPEPVYRKVAAATGGSMVGSWTSIIVLYAFEKITGTDLPFTVEGAVFGLVTTGLTFLAGYMTRED